LTTDNALRTDNILLAVDGLSASLTSAGKRLLPTPAGGSTKGISSTCLFASEIDVWGSSLLR
jgi:hypothetical protein